MRMNDDDKAPKDYVEGLIDAICIGGGTALIIYLKTLYAADVGDWLLSLVGQ
jgi:hypothetical protein